MKESNRKESCDWPRLTKIIWIMNKTGAIIDIRFELTMDCSNGQSISKVVDNIKKISLFELFLVPDPDEKESTLLQKKLQQEASSAEQITVIEGDQGLYRLDANTRGLLLGDQFMKPEDIQVAKGQIDGDFTMKRYEGFNYDDIIRFLPLTIQFIPEASPIVFYSALTSVIRPLLVNLGYKPQYITLILGEPGHFKSFMAERYALWLTNENIQKFTFNGVERINDIIDTIKKLEGNNILVDDMNFGKDSRENRKINTRLNTIARQVATKYSGRNVFITAEELNTSLYSLLDRLLIISVPEMNEEERIRHKKLRNEIPLNLMSEIAIRFAHEIYGSSISYVSDMINDFLGKELKNVTCERTGEHAAYVKLTEFLFRQLICKRDETVSQKEWLYSALDKQIDTQLKLLRRTERLKNRDYTSDFIKIITTTGYLKRCTSKDKYYGDDDSYLHTQNMIFITGSAIQKAFHKFYSGDSVKMSEVIKSFKSAGVLYFISDGITNTVQIEISNHLGDKKKNKKRCYKFIVSALIEYSERTNYESDRLNSILEPTDPDR